jgi:hypothetical protein
VAELADAYGSGPYGATRGGSSPLVSTGDPWALFVYGMIEHFRNKPNSYTFEDVDQHRRRKRRVGNQSRRGRLIARCGRDRRCGPDELFPSFRVSAGGGDFRAARLRLGYAYELLRKGVTDVYRETFGSAVDLSVRALGTLGLDGECARRAAQIFPEHDEASVREMAQVQNGDDAAYVSLARLRIENLERALASDREMFNDAVAQNPEQIR